MIDSDVARPIPEPNQPILKFSFSRSRQRIQLFDGGADRKTGVPSRENPVGPQGVDAVTEWGIPFSDQPLASFNVSETRPADPRVALGVPQAIVLVASPKAVGGAAAFEIRDGQGSQVKSAIWGYAAAGFFKEAVQNRVEAGSPARNSLPGAASQASIVGLLPFLYSRVAAGECPVLAKGLVRFPQKLRLSGAATSICCDQDSSAPEASKTQMRESPHGKVVNSRPSGRAGGGPS
ncbi:MAG: hypothetical protein FD126_705 [Elusimicrobia bacterium]|nr:MAG: hypothetical protein FD126_705 [Elusimicrobiota bacterium]